MKRILLGLACLLAMPLAACAHATGVPKDQDDGVLHSYILLDRTGSMSSLWDEALSSVNAYAASVAEGEDGDTLETLVTLAVFDAQDGLQFDVLRNKVVAANWTDVTDDEANPRGTTPLFDAIGRMVNLVEEDQPEKAILVIMTDGLENASRELTRDGARAALDRAREKGWEVVFLGADFADFGDADAVGVTANKTMAASQGTLSVTMGNLAQKSRAYGKGEEESVEFDKEDRALAKEEEVKKKK